MMSYTLPTLPSQIWNFIVVWIVPAIFPEYLLFNLITSWKIIILPTFEPENAELIILFLGSAFVYLNGVGTSHGDSMSISRSIVASLPLAFALHYHSNDFLTLLCKLEIYIPSCGDKWRTWKSFVMCNYILISTLCIYHQVTYTDDQLWCL